MRTKDKQLLLKDLCGRLPYGVKGVVIHYDEETNEPSNVIGVCRGINYLGQVEFFYLDMEGAFNRFPIEDFKPYLRPMSSMTEEEKKEMYHDCYIVSIDFDRRTTDMIAVPNSTKILDWLNKNHFNYRNLPEHLYIKVTKENNPYKK